MTDSTPHKRPLEFAAIDDPTVAWTSRTFEGSEWVREENFSALVERYENLFGQLEAARKAYARVQGERIVLEEALREIHDYLSGITASGLIGEADWDDLNGWLAKNERYATLASTPAISQEVSEEGEGPGWCSECGAAQTSEEAVDSDFCFDCDPASEPDA